MEKNNVSYLDIDLKIFFIGRLSSSVVQLEIGKKSVRNLHVDQKNVIWLVIYRLLWSSWKLDFFFFREIYMLTKSFFDWQFFVQLESKENTVLDI